MKNQFCMFLMLAIVFPLMVQASENWNELPFSDDQLITEELNVVPGVDPSERASVDYLAAVVQAAGIRGLNQPYVSPGFNDDDEEWTAVSQDEQESRKHHTVLAAMVSHGGAMQRLIDEMNATSQAQKKNEVTVVGQYLGCQQMNSLLFLQPKEQKHEK
jgi:hypothetical protein